MTTQLNPFLQAEHRVDLKGGVQTIEDPSCVENIVFQTRGAALDPFEDRLAGDLMAVFGQGAYELADVVDGLNAAGSRDRGGAEWSEWSFEAQMAESASALFAISQGAAS